jgi:hypothetical protein
MGGEVLEGESAHGIEVGAFEAEGPDEDGGEEGEEQEHGDDPVDLDAADVGEDVSDHG